MGVFWKEWAAPTIVLAMLPGVAGAAETSVHLASLDWPPYSSEAAPHGASEAVARQAFAAMGYSLQTDFMPWQRATTVGKTDKTYFGYYPEYYSTDLTDCLFSDSMGNSPLGLVERKDANLVGKSLDDLKTVTIGTVSGYVNTAEFDTRAKDGRISVEEADDDITNLRKVAAGRIPAAVIDSNVMAYYLASDADLKAQRGALVFDGSAFENKTLHVCFRKDDEGKKMAEAFNQGLKKIDVKAIMDAYLKENLK
ncbi:MAG: ABC transporter substrate-binding protein [Azospirillaceae bacterium]|nr:ABC transporter substrate-binding protein [Azospirillaceae bacterium]